MKKPKLIALLGLLLLMVPTLALAAAPRSATHRFVLHVTMRLREAHPAFAKVSAQGWVRQNGHDSIVNVQVRRLPGPGALHKRAYVVFATDMHMSAPVGMLRIHMGAGSLQRSIMMTNVTDVYVYALGSTHAMHPKGKLVLSAMV